MVLSGVGMRKADTPEPCPEQDEAELLETILVEPKIVYLDDVISAPQFRIEGTYDHATGEWRWVAFARDRRGAIGKLIFTVHKEDKSLLMEGGGHHGLSAHIKSITVHQKYRGHGLSKVLFLACLKSLAILGVDELFLEAEEDTRRHDKLVGLYRDWGFSQKAGAKALYLHNGNECFRKVPMVMSIPRSLRSLENPVSNWFCMLTLQGKSGEVLCADSNGHVYTTKSHPKKKSKSMHWEAWLSEGGEIFLRSVHGKFLCAEPSDEVVANRQVNSTWETFQLVMVDTGMAVRTFHGKYLSLDQENSTAVSTKLPAAWDAVDSQLVNRETSASTLEDLHLRIMRKFQTVDFVQRMRSKYLDRPDLELTISQAWRRIRAGNPVLAGKSLALAEKIRLDGHPDWMQLTALVAGLGQILLHRLHQEMKAGHKLDCGEQWIQNGESWIVGCRLPDELPRSEVNKLNPDAEDLRYNSQLGMYSANCGLENVLMPFTPDEYLYHVLLKAKSYLPKEALAMIRYRHCGVLLSSNVYEHLLTMEDMDLRYWAQLFRDYSLGSSLNPLSAATIDELWPEYETLISRYIPQPIAW